MEFNSLLRRVQAGFRHLAHGRATPYVAAAAVFSLALAGAGAVQLRAQPQADLAFGPAPASASASTLPGELPAGGGGAKNIVQLRNISDGTLKAGGRVQVTSVPAPNFAAANIAIASSSCVNCQTLAVALQINLVGGHVTYFHPQNAAVASNAGCSGCDTVARAIQYNIGVADPNQPPPEVRQMVTAMNAELARIDNGNVTLAQAEAEIDAVIAQFNGLAASLTTQRDEATVPNTPGASPSPTATPLPAGSPSPASGTTTTTPTPAISPSPT
jgi:Fe-S cluster biogenesis protein NfuA